MRSFNVFSFARGVRFRIFRLDLSPRNLFTIYLRFFM
jgi:hypothetical protein